MSIFGTPLTAPTALGSGTSLQTTTGINTQIGDLLVAIITGSSGVTTSISNFVDTAGNTFVVVGSPSSAGNSSGAGSVFVAYCLSATHASASNKFTATFGASQAFSLMFVWDVPITGTVLFDITSLRSNGTASTTPTTNAFTTTGSDEFACLMATNTNTGQTYAKQASWSTLDSAAFATGTGGAQHTVFTSPQSGVTANMTSASSNYTIGLAAFKALTISPISASITGVGSMSAAIGGKTALSTAIGGKATLTAGLAGKGTLSTAIAGHGAVIGLAKGTGALSSAIHGQASLSATPTETAALACLIRGQAFVSATLQGLMFSGFAPNFYFVQGGAGLSIFIATGNISGVIHPGQVVNLPPNSTTTLSMDRFGVIQQGMASGEFPIARVVTGQVITSGNLPSNANFSAGRFNPRNAANVQYSDGVLSITDLRP